MPATLSIITNVFPPEERGRAIGIWAAIAGVATALGPISGGFLVEHFYWGSIFLVNLPIVAVALTAGALLVPTSQDPSKPAFDPVGALLSIVGLVAARVRHHPGTRGGLDLARDPHHLRSRARSCSAGSRGGSRAHRARCSTPRSSGTRGSPRRAPASCCCSSRCSGSIFLQTQYLQFVMGYDALEAGVRLLPDGDHDAPRRAEQRPHHRAARHEAGRGHRPGPRRAVARPHGRSPRRGRHVLGRRGLAAGDLRPRHGPHHGARPPSRSWARCRGPRPGWAAP